MDHTLVISYKGCGNVETAKQIAEFIHRGSPNCLIIIHRDRDFMTNEEVQLVKEKIESYKTLSYITDNSDVEAYFCSSKHLSFVLGTTEENIELWLNELAISAHVKLQEKFSKKREEIKYQLYKENRDDCPSMLNLFGEQVPTRVENRLGKLMLKRVNGGMHARFGVQEDLYQRSDALIVESLQTIKHMIL